MPYYSLASFLFFDEILLLYAYNINLLLYNMYVIDRIFNVDYIVKKFKIFYYISRFILKKAQNLKFGLYK